MTAKVLPLHRRAHTPPAVDPPEYLVAASLVARFGRTGSLLVARYLVMLVAVGLDGEDAPRPSHTSRALARLGCASRSITRTLRILFRRAAR